MSHFNYIQWKVTIISLPGTSTGVMCMFTFSANKIEMIDKPYIRGFAGV